MHESILCGELGIDCKLGKKPVPHFKLAKLGMDTLRNYFAYY